MTAVISSISGGRIGTLATCAVHSGSARLIRHVQPEPVPDSSSMRLTLNVTVRTRSRSDRDCRPSGKVLAIVYLGLGSR